MAKLYLYRDKLQHNYKFLNKIFKKNSIDWAVVTKLLCGNKKFLKELLSLHPGQVCDSRISHLKTIKTLSPQTETVYIRPPSRSVIKKLVRYADISLNTELETLKMISNESLIQNKCHKIILMIELGDLREGILSEDLADFYSQAMELKGIRVIGIGANLNCLHGVMPSLDKLQRLIMYKERLELKFNKKIPFISGGTTVTLPMLLSPKNFPKSVNHFRIGEALFFGVNLFEDNLIKGMYPFTFELEAQVIELNTKLSEPIGKLKANPSGVQYQRNPKNKNNKVQRAIIDVGSLDILPKFLIPKNKHLKIIGASSDMMVVDITKSHHKYPVGSTMRFQLKYMGALGLLNSRYIEKLVA